MPCRLRTSGKPSDVKILSQIVHQLVCKVDVIPWDGDLVIEPVREPLGKPAPDVARSSHPSSCFSGIFLGSASRFARNGQARL